MDLLQQAADEFYNAGVAPEQAKQYIDTIKGQIGEWQKQGLPPDQAKQNLSAMQFDHQDANGKRIKISPFLKQAEQAQVGKLKELDQSSQRYQSVLESRQASAADEPAITKLSDFTKARQQSAIQDPTFQALKNSVIPTAAGAAGLIPGVGTLAGATISAGGTAINQALGNEPFSLGEIAKSAAIPLVVPGLSQIPKLRSAVNALGQEAGRFFNPMAYRKAATGAGMEVMGAEADVVKRANMLKPSDKVFEKIRANTEEVPTHLMSRGITNAFNDMPKSNQPKEAIDYLNDLKKVYDAEPTLPYANISKELNGMYSKAQEFLGGANPNSSAGHAIMEARGKIIAELGKVGKEVPEAYELYKKENSVEKISKALNAPKPDIRLGELLLKDKLVRSSIPVDVQDILMKIAEKAATAGTQASPYGGATAKVFNLLTFPMARLAANKTGQYLLRQTFQDGVVTLPKLNLIGQFGRAWIAQGEGEETK